ncbi:hypothetical protein JM664_08665 [Rhodobacteraceae bacterium MCCB 386]|nr:hypothetical protein [Roseitranquillus sediminis]
MSGKLRDQCPNLDWFRSPAHARKMITCWRHR